MLTLLFFLPFCFSWGHDGHYLTAAVAEALLTDSAIKDVNRLLGYQDTLTSVASWADTIKRRPEYRFTSPLHYSNPLDDEPRSCSYSFKRDCPDSKCLIGALTNYTERFDKANDYTKPERAEALKFVDHFAGDLHQPLHLSGRERGGNGAEVRFFGVKTNLHSVWDSLLIQKRLKDDFNNDLDQFTSYLLDRLSTEWKKESQKWLQCRAPSPLLFQQFFVNKKQPQWNDCFEYWARQSNQYDCTNTWYGYYEGIELGAQYYEKNIDLVEKLLVMGGVRLAYILNSLSN